MRHPLLLLLLSTILCAHAGAQADTLEVVGTGDGMSVLQALASAFMQRHPEHQLLIPESIGSSGGIKAVGSGHAAVGRVARTLKPREAHYALTYRPLFRFPVVFFVNQSVSLEGLTRQQVLGIYSGAIGDWAEVGAAAGKIRVVRREEGDSSLTNLRATFPGFAEIAILPFSKTTTSTQQTMAEVAEVSGAIGFGPLADTLGTSVRVLRIDDQAPEADTYPSYGVLAIITPPGAAPPLLEAWLDFIHSDAGQATIRAAHAIPIL